MSGDFQTKPETNDLLDDPYFLVMNAALWKSILSIVLSLWEKLLFPTTNFNFLRNHKAPFTHCFRTVFVSGKLYSLIFLAFCNLTSLLCFLLSTLHVFHSTVWVQDFLIAILIILCHVKYLVARTHTTALTFNVKAKRRFCVRLFPHFKRQPQ